LLKVGGFGGIIEKSVKIRRRFPNLLQEKRGKMRRSKVNSRSVRVVIFGVFVLCAFFSVANGAPWAGSGVEGDPYLIYDANDMQAIGADSNWRMLI
jgi:hypothetical protein